jgi:hypothetical protein
MNTAVTIIELAWAEFRRQIEPEIAKKRKRFPNTVPEAEWHKPKDQREPVIPSIYDEDEP